MIEVKYDFKNLEVNVDGHAKAAKAGEDIYCAGVSALTVALAVALKGANEQGLLKELVVEIEDGHSHIKAKSKAGAKPIVQTIFTTIFNGYDAMSVSFPEYVSFTPIG